MSSVTTAPATTADQLSRRDAAIAASGWGQPFHLFQPHNLAFWVWSVGVLYGIWGAISRYAPLTPVATEALITGAIVAGVFGGALWLFFRSIDRYDRLPPSLLVTAFLWGGLAAVYAIAINGNDANMELMAKLGGQGLLNDWGPGLSAPLVEETAKGAGFLLLLTLAPKLLHSPRAALITGAFIGLGFQILEDDHYSLGAASQGFFADQTAAVLHSAMLRTLTGLISHPAYTAVFCVGLLYLVGTPALKRDVPRGLLFMLFAVLVHFSWDASGAIGGTVGVLVVAAMLFSTLLAIFALRWAFRLSQPLEQQWMRDILAPEVQAGHVTTEEIDAAAGRRKERKAFIKATHGRRERRRTRHVLEATIDLAHDLAASSGAETAAVQHARAELLRLRSRPGDQLNERTGAPIAKATT